MQETKPLLGKPTKEYDTKASRIREAFVLCTLWYM